MVKFLAICILLIPLTGWSQVDNLILEGVVINNTGNPIPFAALQIKHKYIGISANEQGEFRFVIPTSSSKDTLVVSSLGYKSFAGIISTFDPSQLQTIQLIETAVMLKEVIIKDIPATEILKQAIRRMENHFDKEAYAMESFFRIAVKKDSTYIGLLDAAIDIHDGGFNKRYSLSADLLQLRKIVYKDNWLPGSSLNFRSPAVSIEEEFGKRLRKGILNYSKAMKFWELELDEPAQQDDELFYILKATPKRSGAYNPYYYATIHIRAKDYAIMQITYDYHDDLIKFSKQFPAAHPYGGYMTDKTLLHYNTIRGEFIFSEYDDKLYLSRAFYEETGRLSNEPLHADFAYEGSFEIFVNRIFQGRDGQASRPISKHDDIFKLTDQYDSTFWSNYNKPISTQLYEKTIANMEQNGNLSEQFQYFTSLQNKNTREYALTQRKQSAHFIFNYSPSDASVIDTIVNTLEKNYQRVTEDLKSFDQPVVTVKIFPNLNAYHQSTGIKKAPAWMIGSSFGADEFRIVSPLHPGPAHSYESILKAMVHEFTHCVHANITSDKIPTRWLWEAIACYEADQFIDPAKLSYMKSGNFPTLNQMSNYIEKGYVYELGYVVIKYIKEKWGMEKVVELIQSNADLKHVLGIDDTKFEEDFYMYVKANYLKGVE